MEVPLANPPKKKKIQSISILQATQANIYASTSKQVSIYIVICFELFWGV